MTSGGVLAEISHTHPTCSWNCPFGQGLYSNRQLETWRLFSGKKARKVRIRDSEAPRPL